MPITQHDAVCDEFMGFAAPGFRLRLTLSATDAYAHSTASDLIRRDRERINDILGTAFAQVITLLRDTHEITARRDTDFNEQGASIPQNP